MMLSTVVSGTKQTSDNILHYVILGRHQQLLQDTEHFSKTKAIWQACHESMTITMRLSSEALIRTTTCPVQTGLI